MNRVENSIQNMKKQIQQRLDDGAPANDFADAAKNLDMELDEYVNFQNLKSLASINGTLTLDEAQTVYKYLGETLETFNKQPLHIKYVLNQLHSELLQRRIKELTKGCTEAELPTV